MSCPLAFALTLPQPSRWYRDEKTYYAERAQPSRKRQAHSSWPNSPEQLQVFNQDLPPHSQLYRPLDLAKTQSLPAKPLESSPTLPLTVRNLRKHTSITNQMANNGQGSPSSRSNLQSKGVTSASTTAYTDGSLHSAYLTKAAPKDSQTIGRRMAEHGLILNDKKAFGRYKGLRQTVADIIHRQAAQAPRDASVKKFERTLEYYGRSNEATFLGNMFPLIIKDGFFVTEGDKTTEKDFMMDYGLAKAMDSEFRGTLLPNKYSRMGFQQEMATALKKGESMKNPKPDYMFGIATDWTPSCNLPVPNPLYKLMTIAKDMYHPFLIVEGKGNAGVESDAADQARRGGATLVNATRIVAELLGHQWDNAASPDRASHSNSSPSKELQIPTRSSVRNPTVLPESASESTADLHTMVFSAVIVPQMVTIYVHWFEKTASGDEFYHMNQVFSRELRDNALSDENTILAELRRVLHNIIYWGCTHRLQQHKGLWTKVDGWTTYYNNQNKSRTPSSKKRKETQENAEIEAFESIGASLDHD